MKDDEVRETQWNHRLVKLTFADEDYYGIYEIYYDKDGKPVVRTEEPINVVEESAEEVRGTLERMLKCLDKPVLVDAEMGWHENEETTSGD